MQKAFRTWLDDFIMYAQEKDDLIKSLNRSFSTRTEYNSKLSAKMQFFSGNSKVVWKNNRLSELQTRPKNIEAIRNMDYSTTADELCKIYSLLSMDIKMYPRLSPKLQTPEQIVGKEYASCEKWCNNALKMIALSKLCWGATHKASFSKLMETLKNVGKLAHLKIDHTTAVSTDASDNS